MIHKVVFLLAAFGAVKANLPMLLSQEGYQSYGGRPGVSGLLPGKGPSSHSLHHLSPSASEDSSFDHSHDFHHLPKAQHHLEPRPFRRPLDADDSHFVERHMPHMPRSGQFAEESPQGYSSQSHEEMNHPSGGDGTPDDHYLHHPSEHNPPESHSLQGFSADHDQGHFQPGHSTGHSQFDDSHQPRFEESRYSEPESDSFQSDHPSSALARDEGDYHIQGPSHQFNYDEGGQLLPEEFNAKHGSAPSPWMSGQLMSSQPGGSEFGLPSGTGVNIGVAPLDSATIGARSRQLGIRPPRMGRAIPNEAFRKFRPMTMSLRPRGPPPMSGLSHSEPMPFQPHMSPMGPPPRPARMNFAHSMGALPMGGPPHSAMNIPPPRMAFRAEPHSDFDAKSVGAFSEMMGGGGPHGYFGGNAWKK